MVSRNFYGLALFAHFIAEDAEEWLGKVQGTVATGALKIDLPGSRAGGCQMLQASLQLEVILLPQPPGCLDYTCVP